MTEPAATHEPVSHGLLRMHEVINIIGVYIDYLHDDASFNTVYAATEAKAGEK